MPRYQILIEYLGSNFRGWQVQKKGKTVQGLIQEKIENTRGKVGEVLDDYLTISCVDGAIKILELQKEGKKKMSTKEFLTGNKISKGDILN